MAVRREDRPINNLRWLFAVVSLSAFLAVPARCPAQSLSLASDSSFAVFENGGRLTVTSSTITGNVDLASNSPNYSIKDLTFKDFGSLNTGVPASLTTLPTVGSISSYGADGEYDIKNVNSSQPTFTGVSGINIFNIYGDFNVKNSTLNLQGDGSGNDTFIFNVLSAADASGLSFKNVTMNLSGGLTAKNVIFNVVNGDASILNSNTVDGTFYTNAGNVSLNQSNLTGTLVAGGGNDISILNSTITTEPSVTAAPEMPTIMTAGIGMFLLAATSSYRNRVTRKRSANAGPIAA
jgi:hypothetical protein